MSMIDLHVSQQLTEFSLAAYEAKSISDELAGLGLGLLTADFGGRSGPESEPVRSVKDELLRVRFGNWHVRRAEDSWQALGYSSSLLDKIQRETGVSPEQLTQAGREANIDSKISSLPWGHAFTSSRLEQLQSQQTSAAVSAEQLREAAILELEAIEVPNAAGVRRAFLDLLKIQGYNKFGVASDGDVLLQHKSSPHLRLCLRVTAVTGHTSVVSISILPLLELSGASEPVHLGFSRGTFFAILEPFIEGFGRYRAATGAMQFSLQLYAYRHFLMRVLPLLESSAARARQV